MTTAKFPASLTFAQACNGSSINPYKDVIEALSLPHKSDRILALRALYRRADDPEAVFSVLAHLASEQGGFREF